ncbi:glycine/betaine ABC transporter permease [Yersinia enterocolitica]|nr:glycine/betaine ABC transporter permease [Yersinia enterocolitica]
MRLLFSPAAFSSAATTPVPVLIAGTAIIATRFVGVILLVATLGWEGTGSFIYESLQSWDSGLIFIASILILLLEMVCGVAVYVCGKTGRAGAMWPVNCWLLSIC